MTQVIEKIGGEYENRTHVHGFAIRCVTTPPTRRSHGFIRGYVAKLQGGKKRVLALGATFLASLRRDVLDRS